MRNIKEILRLKWEANISFNQIAKSCRYSTNTVISVINRAEAAGLTWPLPQDIDEAKLEAMLYQNSSPQNKPRPLPDMNYIHRELKRKGVTLQLLWQEYKQQQPDGLMYSQFCDRYLKWRGQLDVSMRQVHRAGEKMFVDWAGQTTPVVDQKTGEKKEAYLFVAVLGASNYTYAEASLSQDLAHWIAAHCRTFAYFQGVPEIVVPDNLRTGISKPCYYEPEINPTYQDMATHYNTAIIPARVRKPKDKSKAEGAVLIAERWILAALRNHTFFSIAELNEAIGTRLTELNNKQFQKLEGSRRSLFETIDRPALKPLPIQAYEFAIWKKVRANIDHHVEFETNYYSVPYQLIKQRVDLRITQNMVEAFFKGRRIAGHPRSFGKRQYITEPGHRPASHRAYLEWTPSRIIDWAGAIGANTAQVVKELMESKPHAEQGYRACLGIIRLGMAYSSDRMESAAKRALACKAISYRSMKSILKNGLDQIEQAPEPPDTPIQHKNIRGKNYYAAKEEGVPLC